MSRYSSMLRGMLPALCLLCACSEAPPPPPAPSSAGGTLCSGRASGDYCQGEEAFSCAEELVIARRACAQEGLRCVEGRCLTCRPGRFGCDGQDRLRCRPDGGGYERLETCPAGLSCTGAACVDLCARAAEERSYIGCEYWPVTTRNGQLDAVFQPALVVANPQLVPADVSLTRDGVVLAEASIGPSEVTTFELPFVGGLRGAPLTTGPEPLFSSVVSAGAYRLRASVPVTVHQYNPLEFAVDEPCADPRGQDDARCFSHTNDASLLLPTHVLTSDYMAVSRGTFMVSGEGEVNLSPGFVAVVAVGEQPVEVEILSSAYTAPSEDGSLPALAPGERASVTLRQGDVLQLLSAGPPSCTGDARQETLPTGEQIEYCDLGPRYDLTGTQIRASAPVQVVAGHDCTFVPFDEWACDHLEESMFPVEAWGREVPVTLPRGVSGRYWLRVVSSADDNRVSFDPPVADPVTLQRGQWFELEATTDVLVTGSEPLAAAQYFPGQARTGLLGDPSMVLAIPREQFKSSYAFLTPSTFVQDYLNLVVPEAVDVTLDGVLVQGLEPIGDSALRVARVPLLTSGVHRVSATGSVGIVVYGFANFTSYAVPGGLDFRLINPPL